MVSTGLGNTWTPLCTGPEALPSDSVCIRATPKIGKSREKMEEIYHLRLSLGIFEETLIAIP